MLFITRDTIVRSAAATTLIPWVLYHVQAFAITWTSYYVLILIISIAWLVRLVWPIFSSSVAERISARYSLLLSITIALSVSVLAIDWDSKALYTITKFDELSSDVLPGRPIQNKQLPMDPLFINLLADWYAPFLTLFASLTIVAAYRKLLVALTTDIGFTNWSLTNATAALYVSTGFYFSAIYSVLPLDIQSKNATSFTSWDSLYLGFVGLAQPTLPDMYQAPTAFARCLVLFHTFVGSFLLLGVFVTAAMNVSNARSISSKDWRD